MNDACVYSIYLHVEFQRLSLTFQSTLANSKMAHHHWSSVEYKTVGQLVSWSVSASQLESMRVRAAERASEVDMVS
jgi:hypothetical protein